MVIGSQPALRYPCLPPANNGNGFWRLKDCETGTRARSRNTQLPGEVAGEPRHDGKSRCPDEPVATSRLAQVAVRAQMRSHEEWTGWDLNPRPLPCQDSDLPADLPARDALYPGPSIKVSLWVAAGPFSS